MNNDLIISDQRKTSLLYEIISLRNDDRMQDLKTCLKKTCELLDLEIGIISKIEENSYEVIQFYPSESGLQIGQTFPLGNTYCSIALNQDGVLAIDNMAESNHKAHPCYQLFNLESYIGISFEVNDQVYGTINFSSTKARTEPFSAEDHMLVKLLAEWAGGVIQHHQTQQKLYDERELFANLSQNSSELLCLHKPDGTYTYVSESVKNILGYTPEELIGTSPYLIFHQGDLQAIADGSHAKAKKGEDVQRAEYRIKRKDGTYIWFDTATKPIKNEHGVVTALQTTSREITEKKRLERLFAQTQQMAKIGGWEFDLETQTFYVTEETSRIHGLEGVNEIHMTEALMYYPEGESRDTVIRSFKNCTADSEPFEYDVPFISANKVLRFVRVIGEAVTSENGTYKITGSIQDITEMKKLENLFTDSQSMAKVGGWEYNLKTGSLFWTDEVYRIHELDLDEELRVEDGLSYYPDDGSREVVQKALENSIQTGEDFEFELPIITAKGNRKYVKAIGQAISQGDTVFKIQGTFQDITEKKKLENLFQDTQKVAHVGAWDHDILNKHMFWTDEMFRIHDLDPNVDKINPEQSLRFFTLDSHKLIEEANMNAVKTGEHYDLEVQIITQAGVLKHVRVIGHPVVIEGSVHRIFGTYQDISEKKKIELLFDTAQQIANVGGWEIDVETNKIYWSDEVYRIHEVDPNTPPELIEAYQFFPDNGARDTIMRAVKYAMEIGKSYDLELPFITAKGNHRFVRAIGKTESLNGKVYKLHGTFQDITDTKIYIDKVASQNDQLAKDKVTREKLYSILAHDLRNSMYGVSALLGLIVMDMEEGNYTEEDMLHKLKLIQGSSANGLKLLENIQNWVKIQSGELEVISTTFDIKNQVEITLELLNSSLKAKEIEIRKCYTEQTEVFGDPQMLTTIIRNLINNAIKFSKNGSFIDISIEHHPEDFRTSVSIKDHGIGMPDHVLDNLFNPAKRPKRAGTNNESGTGLGLMLCKELSDYNHCTIEVLSEPDKGSEFIISIPTKELSHA
jgi:PAS domain S-box-containing protein